MIVNRTSAGIAGAGVVARLPDRTMWDDHDVPEADQSSSKPTGPEVWGNQRSFRSYFVGLVLVLLLLTYIAIAVLASGNSRLLGVAGTIMFGVVVLFGGASGARR